ncbi:condensation domain-containing protein [Streptomyces sp. NBC_01239]|uniref:condensation domain-containing protein n=1 Tax=Streptomyces sp. NBC_01239 TaxID=2903792 RepID=UPI0022528E91|nr:condensation domain-containing protein [Streptomyces sp. NBC_01239]MCX4815702.1 condensation domain-containing protein [Streptomyces sp. NBC_01239]
MRQFPLEALDLAPGRLVEWRLHRTGERGGGAGEGPVRRASFNQDKHFTVAEEGRREDDEFSSWLAVTFEVPGALDRRALESALLHFARRHEVLRCEFRRLAGELACEPLRPEDIGLTAVDVGEFESTEELRTFLADGFKERIDTLSWPLFLMGAVVRDDVSTVYLAFDHIVCDGMSMPNVVSDVRTAYASYAAGREVVLPTAGSYLDFAQEQRDHYLSISESDSRLDYWKSFIARNGEFFPRFPLDLGIEPGRTYPTVNEAGPLLDARQAAELESRCRAVGGKAFMGVLAAVAIALRQAGGPGVYRGLMPVSERGRGDWLHSMGWFVNTMPIEFSVAEDEDFAEVMANVRAGFAEMLRSVDVPFVRVWELLAPDEFALRTWPFPVNFFSYVDMRKCPGAEHHEDWRPTAHVWASRSNGTSSWFQRDTSGLHINSIYADTPQSRRTMTDLRRRLRRVLLEISRRGTIPVQRHGDWEFLHTRAYSR